MQKDKKIVIVGAGLSGISAAVRLIENGYENIEIVEALGRKGGRIYSVDYGTGKLDMGAQWIHGDSGNEIWEMVHNYQPLGSTPFDSIDGVYLMSTGTSPDQEKCIKVQRLLDKILKAWSEMRTYSDSFGQFVKTKYRSQLATTTYADIDANMANMFEFDALKQVAGFYGCSSWFDLSAKLNAQYSGTQGDQDITWKDKGFVTAFDYITKKLPNPDQAIDVDSKITYNAEVVNIKYNKDNEAEKCVVTLANKRTIEADNVIVTVSLGVLQNHHSTLFTPQLEGKKFEAVKDCRMGTIGKVFLKFDERFWPEDANFISYMFLWTEEDKASVIGTHQEWLLGLMTFNRVDAYPELLEAFVAGPWLPTFENLPSKNITDDCTWLLEKFLGKKIPTATYVAHTKWLTNDKFYGAYSYISFASQRSDGTSVGPSDLAEPIYKTESGRPFVHFAGEATNEQFPSYAHGAVLSGYRAAAEAMKTSS